MGRRNVAGEDDRMAGKVTGEGFWLSNVDRKKCLMLSAEVALYNSSNDKFFNRKTSPQSRMYS
ncbi:hypothetical protein OSB04_014014 [Centaurea solstitialis]|uniref:Uncharacterized protein n=1 Tax=Centaurea solstitialis TaxID=347529 RepID=A0AA38WNX1_9ASTR|nr:hypothetical protein OSB04_014014 [Centaurea solstitialis]